MSSRKSLLLITVLATVLVGIGAYVYVTWEPENPLRFRMVAITPLLPSSGAGADATAASAASGATSFEVEFAIENTSSVPLNLDFADAIWDVHPGMDLDLFDICTSRPIAAHGTLQLKRHVPPQIGQALEGRHVLSVSYSTVSPVKQRAIKARVWLYNYLPRKVFDRLPSVSSYMYETPLEYPSAANPAK